MSAEIPPSGSSDQGDETNHYPLVKYDHFQDDAKYSGELLEAIRQQNRKQLDESGFTLHFLDALRNVTIDPHADVFVAQYFTDEGKTRVIQAVLRQDDETGSRNRIYRVVGYEKDGVRTPAKHFDADDLDLAIAQLDDLQLMKDMGMISLDRSLSIPIRTPGT